MFKRILVPVDGSSTSKRGLAEAIELASDQAATLYLLHVVDDLVVSQALVGTPYVGGDIFDELIGSLREGGRKILATAEALVRKRGIGCESILLETLGRSVASVILDQARKRRADVIVLGTHGRRGLTRLVLGSDAEAVVRSTNVPVLLVRAPEKPRPGRTPRRSARATR